MRLVELSNITKDYYRIGEVAKLLAISEQSLRNYEKRGRIAFERSDGGHRIIRRNDLIAFIRSSGSASYKYDIVYLLVKDSKEYSCDAEVKHIINSCNVGKAGNIIVLKDIGDTNDDKRENLVKLLEMVMEQKVNNVFVLDKHMLADNGLNYIEIMFKYNGVNLIEINEGKVK